MRATAEAKQLEVYDSGNSVFGTISLSGYVENKAKKVLLPETESNKSTSCARKFTKCVLN